MGRRNQWRGASFHKVWHGVGSFVYQMLARFRFGPGVMCGMIDARSSPGGGETGEGRGLRLTCCTYCFFIQVREAVLLSHVRTYTRITHTAMRLVVVPPGSQTCIHAVAHQERRKKVIYGCSQEQRRPTRATAVVLLSYSHRTAGVKRLLFCKDCALAPRGHHRTRSCTAVRGLRSELPRPSLTEGRGMRRAALPHRKGPGPAWMCP